MIKTKTLSLAGPKVAISRKDLTACAKVLKKKLINVGLEESITYFRNAIKNEVYINYDKHIKGLSHHMGLGPARRPYKCYNYIIDYLKGLRGVEKLKDLKNQTIQVLVNSSTDKLRRGVRKCSRGRRYREEARNYNLIIFLD